MRKNKLIALLQNLPGNPDVLVWNGMVEDWMDILPEPVESKLFKDNPQTEKEMIEFDRKKNGNETPVSVEQFEQIKKQIRKSDWEFPNQYADEEQIKRMYGKPKTVFLLNPKVRKRKVFDRLGTISY